MKDEHDQKIQLLVETADAPWIKGPALGASVMWLTTPFGKWTNHALNNEKMPSRNIMAGALSYFTSAVPGYAVAFTTKALLVKLSENTSRPYDLLTSFAAGGFSGVACTPFEVLAQNQQLTHSRSSKATAQKMFRANGYLAFFQGGMGLMLREGCWTTVYMTTIPVTTRYLEAKGVQKKPAALLSTLFIAGTYGLFSTPLNHLYFRKQAGLTEPVAKKSYLAHAKEMWHQTPKATHTQRFGLFFKACGPRATMTTVSAGLLVQGTELYNQVVARFK